MKTIKLSFNFQKINIEKLNIAIKELKNLGVYNEQTQTIIYDETNSDLEQKISNVLEKYFG